MNLVSPNAILISRTSPVCVIIKHNAFELGFADGVGDGNEDRIGNVRVLRAVGEIQLWPPAIRWNLASEAKSCGAVSCRIKLAYFYGSSQ
jgi:hypothetical protein